MTALLDVNVLIALLDAGHLHHGTQTAYPNRAPAAEVAARLTEATQHPAHHFWPDAVSLLSPGLMAWSKLLTGRHITDAYLLALAVENRGTFVTLDQGIPLAAVPGAQAGHLVVLEALKT